MSLDTVQGWESGRRRLPGTRVEVLVDVRHELVACGAEPRVIAALAPAMEADRLLGRTLEADGRTHPLAAQVTTREVHDLLLWTLVGRRPQWLPGQNSDGLEQPRLAASERAAVFARLRELADRAAGHRPSDVQLRRQAAYLAAYDPAPDTDRWLAHLPHASPRAGEWSPAWVAARSSAVTAATRGDPDPLRWFIDHRLADDDRLEAAQLAWNAHYYGELGDPQHSDAFMVGPLPNWRGDRLLGWLAGRLDVDCRYADLIVHTLWALLAGRHYLAADPVAADLGDRIETLADATALSARSRRELGEIRYLLRALNPKGNR